MKEFFIGLFVTPILAVQIPFLSNVNFLNGSSSDLENANKTECFNAFSIDNPADSKFYPSILTQIKNKNFYLKVTNKCSDVSDVNISLIDKNGKKVNASIKKLGFGVLEVKVPKINKDLRVNFKYTRKEVTHLGSVVEVTTKHKEENSTDNFAVRPDKFSIFVENNETFVGKKLKVDLNVTGYENTLCDYNKSYGLKIYAENSELQYSYKILNGKLSRNIFILTEKSDDAKIHISEIDGNEYAIVDSDDTSKNRRLISEGISNSIKVYETSKSWAGVGTGDKRNDPDNRSVSVDVSNPATRNLDFHRIQW